MNIAVFKFNHLGDNVVFVSALQALPPAVPRVEDHPPHDTQGGRALQRPFRAAGGPRLHQTRV